MLDGGPVEPAQSAGQCPYEGFTAGDFEYPVEHLVGSTAAAIGFDIFAGLMWLMWIGEWAGWW